MAGGIKLSWKDRNFAENHHNIYKSNTPMSINNMPTPIATVGANITEYIDYDVIEGNTYYYRVGAVRGNDVAISDEIELIADTTTYDYLDIFEDGSGIICMPLDGDLSEISGNYVVHSVSEILYTDGLNGRESLISTGSNYVTIGATDIKSVSFWMKITGNVTDIGGILQFQDSLGVSVVGVVGGNMVGLVSNASANSKIDVYSSISLDIWYHVYGDRDGNFSINGIAQNTKIHDEPFYATATDEMIVGGRHVNTTYVPIRSDSIIQQVRGFDRSLTNNEIDILVNELN